MAASLKFDEDSILSAKEQLLLPTTPQGWIVVGYEGNTIKLQGKGNTGVDDMVKLLKDDQVQYCLIRLPEVEKDISHVDRKDGKVATKDIFIAWTGPDVRTLERGKKKEHLGQVSKLFKPFHAELTAVSRKNFTEAIVRDRSAPLSGSHIID